MSRDQRLTRAGPRWTARLRVLLPLLVWVEAAAQAAECSYSVRWTEEPPYAMQDKQGKVHGIDTEIVTAILERMGCSWRMVEMPLARALVELEAGRLDILAGVYRTAERERYAWFSAPIYVSSSSLYLGPASREKYKLNKLADILNTDFRLGTERNISHGPAYEALRSHPEFQARQTPVNSDRGRWRMLAAGRIDGLISDDFEAAFDLQALGLTDQVERGLAVESAAPSLVAFSRKSVAADAVARFDAILKQMIEDGSVLRIKQRYVPCAAKSNHLTCR